MKNKSLVIKIYDENKIIVLCDRKKFEDYFETFGKKKWNSDGVILLKKDLEKAEKLIDYLEKREKEKNHDVFSSDGENDLVSISEDEETDSDEDFRTTKVRNIKMKSLPLENKKRSRKKYNYQDPMKYYKSFVCTPADFKKLNRPSDSVASSTSNKSKLSFASSTYYSSSSDGFPSPETPRKQYSVDEILELIHKLTERVIKILFF